MYKLYRMTDIMLEEVIAIWSHYRKNQSKRSVVTR